MGILKNSFKALVVRGLGIAALTGFVFIVARFLNPREYGIVELIITLLNITGSLSLLGFNRLILKFSAAYHQDQDFARINGLVNLGRIVAIVVPTILMTLFLIFNRLFPDPELKKSVFIVILITPLAALGQLHMQLIRGLGFIIKAMAGFFFVRYFISISVFLIFLLFSRVTLFSAIFALACGFFVLAIWDLVRIHRMLSPLKNSIYEFTEWLNTAIPLWVSQTTNLVISRFDILLIGFLLGVETLAFYAIGKRFANLITLVIESVATASAPGFSRCHHRNDFKALRQSARRAALLTFIGSAFIALPILFFSENLLLLFGEQYAAGKYVAIIFATGLLIRSFTGLPGVILNMTKYQKQFATVTTVTSLLYIFSSIPLAAAFGIEGVALSTISAHLLRTIWASFLCRKHLKLITLPI